MELTRVAVVVSALVAAAAPVAAQERPPPVWPPAFSVNFSETTSDIINSYNTTGAWSYDFSNARQRIDRATGKFDRFCGRLRWACYALGWCSRTERQRPASHRGSKILGPRVQRPCRAPRALAVHFPPCVGARMRVRAAPGSPGQVAASVSPAALARRAAKILGHLRWATARLSFSARSVLSKTGFVRGGGCELRGGARGRCRSAARVGHVGGLPGWYFRRPLPRSGVKVEAYSVGVRSGGWHSGRVPGPAGILGLSLARLAGIFVSPRTHVVLGLSRQGEAR